jgi:hypothetical protein
MSIAATYLQDIRVNYPSNLDRDQLRVTRNGLLTAVLAMTTAPDSIVSADLRAKAVASQGRNLDVPVMQKGSVTITNVRTCVVSCSESDSALVRVNWKTLVADICMVPGQYEKNDITYTADLAKKIREIVEAFKNEVETDLDLALDANKNQVYNSPIVPEKYPLAGFALQVQSVDRDFFFNDIDPINFADDYYNPEVYVIGSPALMATVMRYINQGPGNAANTAYQFAGKNFTFSNRVVNGPGVSSTGYFMPNGSMGLLTRVDVDARMRAVATSGVEWFEDTLPDLPWTVGIKYDSDCSDESTLNGSGLEYLTATKVEHWQISFDYAIIVPYQVDLATESSSIRKFEFLP